jgi:hypothetical protein
MKDEISIYVDGVECNVEFEATLRPCGSGLDDESWFVEEVLILECEDESIRPFLEQELHECFNKYAELIQEIIN